MIDHRIIEISNVWLSLELFHLIHTKDFVWTMKIKEYYDSECNSQWISSVFMLNLPSLEFDLSGIISMFRDSWSSITTQNTQLANDRQFNLEIIKLFLRFVAEKSLVSCCWWCVYIFMYWYFKSFVHWNHEFLSECLCFSIIFVNKVVFA